MVSMNFSTKLRQMASPPPFLHNDKPLDVFLAENRGDGFALMPHAMGPVRVATVMSGGLEIVDIIFGGVNIPGWQLASLSYALFPDLMIGCNDPNSDQLRETVYHECAHASHLGQVGPNCWMALVLAEIAAQISTGSSWGNANSLDAGRIAVCESWAEYLGHNYNHRRYMARNSVVGTWESQVEETRNDSPNHIPIGLYHDLVDNSGPEALANDNDGGGFGPILDNVNGFTNAQLFSILTSDIEEVDNYRTALINGPLPVTGNTVQQVNDLFNSY